MAEMTQMNGFAACGKPHNPMVQQWGNIVRCEPGTEFSDAIDNILQYNFRETRAAVTAAPHIGRIDSPEIINGVDPETGEALWGWYVEVPMCLCPKRTSTYGCARADDCPLETMSDEDMEREIEDRKASA